MIEVRGVRFENANEMIKKVKEDIEIAIMYQCATYEMACALRYAYDRGLCPFVMEEGFDASSDLRWWRDENGVLYATDPTIVEPGAIRVYLEWREWAGWAVCGSVKHHTSTVNAVSAGASPSNRPLSTK